MFFRKRFILMIIQIIIVLIIIFLRFILFEYFFMIDACYKHMVNLKFQRTQEFLDAIENNPNLTPKIHVDNLSLKNKDGKILILNNRIKDLYSDYRQKIRYDYYYLIKNKNEDSIKIIKTSNKFNLPNEDFYKYWNPQIGHIHQFGTYLILLIVSIILIISEGKKHVKTNIKWIRNLLFGDKIILLIISIFVLIYVCVFFIRDFTFMNNFNKNLLQNEIYAIKEIAQILNYLENEDFDISGKNYQRYFKSTITSSNFIYKYDKNGNLFQIISPDANYFNSGSESRVKSLILNYLTKEIKIKKENKKAIFIPHNLKKYEYKTRLILLPYLLVLFITQILLFILIFKNYRNK